MRFACGVAEASKGLDGGWPKEELKNDGPQQDSMQRLLRGGACAPL